MEPAQPIVIMEQGEDIQAEELHTGDSGLREGLRTSESLPTLKSPRRRNPVPSKPQPQQQRLLTFISAEDYRRL